MASVPMVVTELIQVLLFGSSDQRRWLWEAYAFHGEDFFQSLGKRGKSIFSGIRSVHPYIPPCFPWAALVSGSFSLVNAEVDGSYPKMTDDTIAAKFRHAFVQGISVALEGAVELVEVGSRRASSGPNDVVVTLSVGEKGDGLVPSSAAGEEAAAISSRV
ncbi:hypothetical protein Tco_0710875 [Tanacetum coccineum]